MLGCDEATVRRALERGAAEGAAKPHRRELSSTTPFRRTAPNPIETQSTAANARRNVENAPKPEGGFSGPLSTRGRGRPPLAPAARVEVSAMNAEEFEVALVRLCRRLAKNRAEVGAMLGCNERSLRRYVTGERAIPEALAAKVRAMLADAA